MRRFLKKKLTNIQKVYRKVIHFKGAKLNNEKFNNWILNAISGSQTDKNETTEELKGKIYHFICIFNARFACVSNF